MDDRIFKQLHKMYASYDISEKAIDDTIKVAKNIVEEVVNENRKTLKLSLVGNGPLRKKILDGTEITDAFLSSIIEIPTFLKKLNAEILERKIQSLPGYVKNRTYEIGIDKKLRKVEGVSETVPQKITLQYFNLRDLVHNYMKDMEIFKEILNEKRQNGEFMAKDIDGRRHKNNLALLPQVTDPSDPYSPVKITLRILLYGDAYTVVNPLGSKTTRNSIQAFYCKILNTNPSGKLNNILVHTLATSENVKFCGRDKALEPFVNEMKLLVNNPIKITVHGRQVTIGFYFAGVTGDSLDLSETFGHMTGSASVFCRECLITRAEFHENINYIGPPKTLAHFNACANRATRHDIGSVRYKEELRRGGYKTHIQTILSQINNFDFTQNKKMDSFHDTDEGVTPIIIISVIRLCLILEIFTVDYLNLLIKNFDYGVINNRDRPSATLSRERIMNYASTTLRQSGAQTRLLAQALPFLIFPAIREYISTRASEANKLKLEQVIKLYDLHLEMLKLFRCRLISFAQIDYLESIILRHNDLFVKLFRSDLEHASPLINKFHHLLHYIELLRELGPALTWETIRFEGLHYLGKLRMQISNNFINVPATIAKRIAINFAYKHTYLEKEPTTDPMSCKLDADNELGPVKSGSALVFDSIFYQKEMILCLDIVSGNLPVFGVIKSLHLAEDTLYIRLIQLKTLYYSAIYCAYVVENTNNEICVTHNDLYSKYPLALWKNSTANTNQTQLQFVFLKTADY